MGNTACRTPSPEAYVDNVRSYTHVTVKFDEVPVNGVMEPMRGFESPKYLILYVPLGVPCSIVLWKARAVSMRLYARENGHKPGNIDRASPQDLYQCINAGL